MQDGAFVSRPAFLETLTEDACEFFAGFFQSPPCLYRLIAGDDDGVIFHDFGSVD